MNTSEFFGRWWCHGSPRLEGGGGVLTYIEGWGVGMKVLFQTVRKHISTGEHSLHISWGSTHLLNLYILFWCRIMIQWSGQPWDLWAFNASLMSNFELVKRVKLGVFGHYGRNEPKFRTLLYPDYQSLKSTIFGTQQQFKFVVSHYPN